MSWSIIIPFLTRMRFSLSQFHLCPPPLSLSISFPHLLPPPSPPPHSTFPFPPFPYIVLFLPFLPSPPFFFQFLPFSIILKRPSRREIDDLSDNVSKQLSKVTFVILSFNFRFTGAIISDEIKRPSFFHEP